MEGMTAGLSASTLVLMLSLNVQQTAPSPAGAISDRPTPVSDCRLEYQQALKSIEMMTATLDEAARSHDDQAMRTAITDAERLLVSLKAKVAACSADPAAVTVDPVCRRKIDPTSAPTATHRGTRYFFCSKADKAKFQRDPKRYVGKAAQ